MLLFTQREVLSFFLFNITWKRDALAKPFNVNLAIFNGSETFPPETVC